MARIYQNESTGDATQVEKIPITEFKISSGGCKHMMGSVQPRTTLSQHLPVYYADIAVSYTHLDVYKRQILQLLIFVVSI